jgi:intein/homing endonuclease
MKNLSTIKVKNIKESFNSVYDIEVKDSKHYILSNGIVSHNSVGSYVPSNIQSGGCLVPGTLVRTPNGTSKIEDIKKGDYVMTLNGEKEVLDTFTFNEDDAKKVWEIELDNGIIHRVSEDHKFLVSTDWKNPYSWKKIYELKETDEIYAIK